MSNPNPDGWLEMRDAIDRVMIHCGLKLGPAQNLICRACASGEVRWRPVRDVHLPFGPKGPSEWRDAVIELEHILLRCGEVAYHLPRVCQAELDDWIENDRGQTPASPPAGTSNGSSQPENSDHPEAGLDRPHGLTITASDTLAQWIFDQHPVDGRKPETFDQLVACARNEGIATFTTAHFQEAYRQVYETQPHRSPASGWPLKEPFRSRLTEKKVDKVSDD